MTHRVCASTGGLPMESLPCSGMPFGRVPELLKLPRRAFAPRESFVRHLTDPTDDQDGAVSGAGQAGHAVSAGSSASPIRRPARSTTGAFVPLSAVRQSAQMTVSLSASFC